jgi:hypothetical protein
MINSDLYLLKATLENKLATVATGFFSGIAAGASVGQIRFLISGMGFHDNTPALSLAFIGSASA